MSFGSQDIIRPLPPAYLADLLTLVVNIPARSSERGSAKSDFVVLRTSRRIGDGTFSVIAALHHVMPGTDFRELKLLRGT